jgi:ABC-type methionine transport system ATPase subunit
MGVSNIIDQEVIMSDQVVRLIYPPSLLSIPIINRLIRQFDLTVNILRAQIGCEDRWIEVQLAGNPAVLEEAVAWLQGLGIQVQPHLGP